MLFLELKKKKSWGLPVLVDFYPTMILSNLLVIDDKPETFCERNAELNELVSSHIDMSGLFFFFFPL